MALCGGSGIAPLELDCLLDLLPGSWSVAGTGERAIGTEVVEVIQDRLVLAMGKGGLAHDIELWQLKERFSEILHQNFFLFAERFPDLSYAGLYPNHRGQCKCCPLSSQVPLMRDVGLLALRSFLILL